MADQAVEEADIDVSVADKLVSTLLMTPQGAKMAPLTEAVLQHRLTEVRDEALAAMKELCDPLPERSRFRSDIVSALTTVSRTGAFTKASVEEACGVCEGYTRFRKVSNTKKGKTSKNPLYEEKMRGFASGGREAVSALEKELIVEWAREQMMVRSGCHRETFRLEKRKLVLVENFHSHYLQLLRQMYERDPTLAGSLLDTKTPITIFQRNIRRAVWVSEQDGFEEGKAADEAERSLLNKRIAEGWKRGKLEPQTIAEFDPAKWIYIVHRSPEWFWKTLKEEGLRFRRDYTPYECAKCKQNYSEKLIIAERHLAELLRLQEPPVSEVTRLEKDISDYQKKARNLETHKRQVARQRDYNINVVEEWLRGSAKRVRVTTDFGASYFIDGGRYVNLILFLKYMDAHGHLVTETIYCCCSDPDERAEDAFYTRAVWHHMLRKDAKGAGRFKRFDEIKLLRDSGPHFQNNNVNEYETTFFDIYDKTFTVSAFAKRHGWNECDGAMARFVKAIKAGSLEGLAPKDAKDAVTFINMHEKFPNCTAYYFEKIDRNPNLFPPMTKFKGFNRCNSASLSSSGLILTAR
jgi:hypothetical protein